MAHYHHQPHFYSTTQTWPPFGRYLANSTSAHTQPPATATDSSPGRSDDSDSTESSEDTVTEASEGDAPTSEQFWSCIACWNPRTSSTNAECQFCDMTTETIKRWKTSKKPVVLDANGSETNGTDIETPWICVRCEETKLFLGGDSSSDPIFESFCASCQSTTDTVYADRRKSYCCRSCRYERPHGAKGRNVRVGQTTIWAVLWSQWCHQCNQMTSTIKLDPTSQKVWCCQHCRFARDPPEDEEDEEEDECSYCQQVTDTVEIDSAGSQ